MNSLNAALLVNCIGFAVGIALYGLLGAMVLQHRGQERARFAHKLLLVTSLLGLIWNVGEMSVFVLGDFGTSANLAFLTATAYSALGFLPSVVVHSAQNGEARWTPLTYIAYAVSSFAATLHFVAAASGSVVPSSFGLMVLILGAVSLAVGLVFVYFRQTLTQRAIWTTALLIFAVSGLHFVDKREGSSWLIELVAHQSSLPLALAILYQNYRFAFADLFLKRAVSLILLSMVAFGLYVLVAAPLLRYHETHDRNDVLAISLILILWIATALVYPSLHRLAVLFVDKVILQRIDYAQLQTELTETFENLGSSNDVLDVASGRLAEALTSEGSKWYEIAERHDRGTATFVDFQPDLVEVFVPTAEPPYFQIELSKFHGGRRLLSDEITMLASISLAAARRIDALRVIHERCEQEYREQEISKLAAEAQLTALRAQVNPHFLFNALTTIGYLIRSSPERAFETLLQLTRLLRGVLRSSDEFCTLGEELKIIESYLEIEKARFEERLTVEIDVSDEIAKMRIPALILQPIVENAIKHGISENRSGGHIGISAEIDDAGEKLVIEVSDTGSGKGDLDVDEPYGVGLSNVRGRLRSYYGPDAGLGLEIDENGHTVATITLPVTSPTGRKTSRPKVARI